MEPFRLMRKQIFDLPVLLVVTTGLALAVASLTHFSSPVAPARLEVLRDVIAGRSIGYSPYTVGYFEFAGLTIRYGGQQSLVAAQAALYVLTILFCHWTLRRLDVHPVAPLLGALGVALYPNLLLSITRFQDTGISCFFLAVFAWLVTRLRNEGFSVLNSVIAGALFGTMLLVRANSLTLAPIALWAAFHGRRFSARQFTCLAGSSVLACCILAAAIIPVKGKFVVFDRYYAAYAFYAGTHEHALEGTLRDYNGEATMPRSLRELGLPYWGLEHESPAMTDEYYRIGWKFIREHPFRYVALELFKLCNLFRPDYRNVANSFIQRPVVIAIQTIIAGIFFGWAVIRWRCRRLTPLDGGLILLPAIILYLGPFVITGTDPRYRVPLDSLFIIDSAFCLSILWNRRPRQQPRA
jgi:hypothetical protein